MEEYIVSARKYRPMTFDTVVGQGALTTTLKNAVKSGKLAHAYLFCGPRGVGKTTCARIFAKAINCEHPREDGEACNECESCKAFNEQRSYNIFELDAASNNGVDQIKTLMEQTRIPPQVGKYKVFIIDEVHMLSAAAFNAFLKTLEEPPSHVIFILATTEKHKILPTILSRCQIYDFERMSVANTIAHLKMVAEKEGVKYEESALAVIAEKADGGMRDALSIFDQVAGYSEGHLTYRKVIEDLNVLDYDYYFKIVDQMLGKNIPAVMLTLNEILSKGFAANHFISGFASHLRDLLVSRDAQTLPLLEVSETVRTRYSEQAAKCRPQFLYRALRFCNDCDLNYRTSSNKRLLVELTLIQVAQAVDDDEAGCGLGPTKILKPLFAAIAPAAAAPQAPKAQPAATTQQRPAATPATTTAPSATLPVANTQNTAAAQHHVRPVSLSISATKMQQRRKQANSANLDQARRIVINEVQPFEWKDLSYQWYRFAMELPQEQNAIAGRMKNMRPQLMDNFVVEVPVENDQVLMLMNSIRDDLVCYLRMGLHNGKVDVRFRIIQAEEAKKRAYTRQEQLAAMLEKSPGLAVLKNTLNLELA